MNIQAPADLTELPNWVLWKYLERDGKRTKVPYSIRGHAASSTNPEDWSTYDDITDFYGKHRKQYAGIGVVFDGTGMCGVDLDHCLNDDQSVKEWAQPIIGRFSETYMEVSPSGTGIKIWCRGKIPGGGITEEFADGRVEIYDRGRYFTVTGNAFNDAPLQVEDQQSDINWLLSLIGRDKPPTALTIPATSFNMGEFIEKYIKPLGWDIKGPFVNHHPQVGGFKWRIEDGCPFQRDYSCGSPALMVTAKGAAYFKCFCGDHGPKGWHDIKALVGAEPEPKPKYVNGHAEEPDEKPLNYTPWPDPLSELAFHGPLGELCKLIEPHSESDISAVLLQSIAMVGNLFGRSAHFVAESTNHYCNEFVCIVGATAKGRKGSGYGQVRRILGDVDEDWNRYRVKSGLTSGEGLIFHVRDEIREKKMVKGNLVEMVTDEGERDKRLLIVEEEMSSAIKAMSREGNTLSGVIRQAWDSPIVLAPMTKNNRICASAPHVSIIGHITKDELIKSLKSVENTNGYTNRFLWGCSKRARILPFGGSLRTEDLAEISSKIGQALHWAEQTRLNIGFCSEAAEMWSIVYEELGNIPAGTIGAVLSRAEPHVRRIATIYAILDKSALILPEHLEAALEVWRYCSDSVRWIFEEETPKLTSQTKVRDKITAAIAACQTGMSRSDIGALLGGATKKGELEFHLSAMLNLGQIHCQREKRSRKSCDFYYAQKPTIGANL